MEHLLSSCTPLAPTMYLRWHNQVLKVLYHYLVGSHTIAIRRDPEAVYENDSIKLYWDQPVQVVGYCRVTAQILYYETNKITVLTLLM